MSTNSKSASIEAAPADPAAASAAVIKRYESLVSLRTKAIKGKGAWYWSHLEPILIRNPDSNLPKSVKLKCNLCNASFSASNPSRTASEHLKRGNCPNSRLISSINPISQLPPLSSPSSHRKRTSESRQSAAVADPHSFGSDPPGSAPKLSGGREDLKPLALLEDSVKKLKTPKPSPVPSLTKDQAETAFDLLSNWFFESCCPLSFTSLEHPKFRAFLNHLGLPELSKKEFLSTRLDSKYEMARQESEARTNDAAFFQIVSTGWNTRTDPCLVTFMVNLPNGTRVFQRVVHCNSGTIPLPYAEEVLWETVRGVCCNGNLQRCVGIVADKCLTKALKNLEAQNGWMVNVPCLLQGLSSLIKDFYKDLPMFQDVHGKCLKVANLINSHPLIRNCIRRFVRVVSPKYDVSKNLGAFVGMLEDILTCSQSLHLAVLDGSFKAVCLDNDAKEVVDMIRDITFWNDVEAVHSLVKLVSGIGDEIDAERPLIGQCLPIWNQLRDQVKEWCAKQGFPDASIEKIVEARFEKSYHPAWSAAFVLDPLYLVRDDATGKYLPPFKLLTNEQEKDVERLIMRMVSEDDEAHVAVIELIKWRAEGLDPLYAQAVQVKQHDPITGKTKAANPQSRRLVWETCLKEFVSLSKIAGRLIFLNATSSSSYATKSDSSFIQWFCGEGKSSLGQERAQKVIYVAAQAKLRRRDILTSSSTESEGETFNDVFDHSSLI